MFEQLPDFASEGKELGTGHPGLVRCGELGKQVDGFLGITFCDCAGFVSESEGVRVGGNCDGGDFEEFLLKVTTTEWGADGGGT